jgi:hypothetical protein
VLATPSSRKAATTPAITPVHARRFICLSSRRRSSPDSAANVNG